VVDELAAEFGALPTAFLPVGHNRLYDLQVPILGGKVYLTLPMSFDLPQSDQDRLDHLGVEVVRIPDGISLGSSVLYALNVTGSTSEGVRILHGDTVIYDLPEGDDVLATSHAPEAYEWGAADGGEPGASSDILAGYFSFADGTVFRRSLAMAQGSFLKAIDNYRAVRPLRLAKVDAWLDCGHLQTYYRSRCSMRIQRSFNDLSISFQVVEKSSQDKVKVGAEADWFESIPSRMRLYTPAFLGRMTAGDRAGYAVEYLPMPSLHELFVFAAVAEPGWSRILEGCFAFMETAIAEGAAMRPEPVIRQLTVDKTEARLMRWLSEAGIPAGQEWHYAGRKMPSLETIMQETAALIDMNSTDTLGIMHGDLCFTNMFYDFRTQRIKVIDPRGTIDGRNSTVLGDLRYDMAKLNHSIVGAYDFILAGRYNCTGFDERDLEITFPKDSAFAELNALAGDFDLRGHRLTDPEICAITIHLFLSMLPLHADRPERQRAFLANSLRLYSERIAT
jgi:hypothetical protein